MILDRDLCSTRMGLLGIAPSYSGEDWFTASRNHLVDPQTRVSLTSVSRHSPFSTQKPNSPVTVVRFRLSRFSISCCVKTEEAARASQALAASRGPCWGGVCR
jgi:hypothetical protein